MHTGHAGHAHVGESAQVATSLVVREDSLTLYGFGSDDERNVFELLQTASGVGPRLALAMLAVHPPDALRARRGHRRPGRADHGPRHRQEGGGADRPGAAGPARPARRERRRARRVRRPPAAGPQWRDQVQSGLVNLGWAARDADAAIAALNEDGTIGAADGEPVDVATVLRAALRKLSKQ